MPRAWKVSEATSIALHAMAMLAAFEDRMLTTQKIASTHNVSEAHLSKVLQRLARAELVQAIRGPNGGYRLLKPSGETTLQEVYEAIEGPLESSNCLLAERICDGKKCVLGDLMETVDREVKEYMSRTKLSDLTDIFSSGHYLAQ